MFDPIDEQDGDMDMMWISSKVDRFFDNELYVAAFKEGGEASLIAFKKLFGNSHAELRKADTSSEAWLYFAAVCKEIERKQVKYELAIEAMVLLKQQAFSIMKSTHDQAILELSPDDCPVYDDRHWTDSIIKTVKKNKKNKK